MLSTLSHSVSVDSLSPSLPASTVDQAIGFLRLYHLSADQQLTIEAAIGQVATQRNCSRKQAALWLHKRAFPEAY
ncbi:MAG: hypothetical protein F6K28_61420 [Microcoleus sp. SIO2G3]|nr:hypothetical protein [Microcoleus sp. SIO2G3]